MFNSKLACIALTGFSFAASAQSPSPEPVEGTRQVTGSIYACMINGVRHYMANPPKSGDCKNIKYNFAEVTPDAGWKQIGQDKKQLSYLNEDKIVREGTKRGVWAMYSMADAQPAYGSIGEHRSSVERLTIDCVKRTTTTLQRTYYTGAVGKGQVAGTWQPLSAVNPTYAVPNTIGEAMVDLSCNPTK